MNRRSPFSIGPLILATSLAGCDYSPKKPKVVPRAIESGPLPTPPGKARPTTTVVVGESAPTNQRDPEVEARHKIYLENIINLMKRAYTKPGGHDFEIATENLDELFNQKFGPADFNLSPASRDFMLRAMFQLTGKDPEPQVKAFMSRTFTARDSRHIEDCMLYHSVATRVAGEGDDLTRVRRIFDWMVRNILLVPPEALSGNGLRQAQARPADVLVRGMAVETQGNWSERGWLFMALCRQINIDVAILTYSQKRPMALDPARAKLPVSWLCGALINQKVYLFDPRIGMEVAGPDGKGVATVDQAIDDPQILERLDLPGQIGYGTTATDLVNSPTKIGVQVESSRGLFAPKMRLLQGELRGENRTILFRDPAEQFLAWSKALGNRFGGVSLWGLPIFVEESLFNDTKFTEATKLSLSFFDNQLPLVYARSAQLRGDLTGAIDRYVALRFAEKAKMKNAEETPITPELQGILDIYSTYFLAECHRDLGNIDKAEYLYLKTLEMVPEPGPGRYYYYFFRWGAQANLGRIYEDRGQSDLAIAYYTQPDRTPQAQGNLLRARDLVLKNPFADPIAPLPPPPPEATPPIKAASN